MTTVTHGEQPYTTDDVPMDQLSLPDQIVYLVYNGARNTATVTAETTEPNDWTTDLVDDMKEFGELVETDDGLRLPEGERPEDAEPEDDSTDEVADQIDDATVAAEALTDDVHVAPEFATHVEHDVAEDDDDDDDDGDLVRADDDPDPEQTAEAREQSDDDTLAGEPAEPADAGTGRLPVNRGYDWSEQTIDRSRVEPYVSANGEYEDVMTEVNTRLETEKLPRFRLVGPSGCGKTSVAENAARDLDDAADGPVPEFTVQCHDGLRPNNLLGMPTYVGDETWWSDGPITKALLASQHGPTVLIFDEINRTTSRTLGVIMSVLDHQCRVTLNARGGEVIRGNPMNLIVFSTMNEGSGYVVNQMDHAQIRRLGNTFETNYVGMNDAAAEADLIAERTPIDASVARPMIDAANDVRQKAQGDSAIKTGIPTSTMLDWAKTAWAHRGTDADGGPLVKAGFLSVVNPFYRDSDEVRSTVANTIETHVRDMSVYPDETRPLTDVSGVGDAKADALRQAGYPGVPEVKEASQQDLSAVEGIGQALAAKIKADVGDADDADSDDVADAAWLVCQDCGWLDELGGAADEVRATMQCPQCDDTLVTREDPE